ncbi:MAG: MFS transporter [Lentisphaeria bacterium]|jgi:MFS family permease
MAAASASAPKTSTVFTPSVAGMLLMVILVGLGEKMAERFLPLYLIELGGSRFAPAADSATGGGSLASTLTVFGALMVGGLNSLDNLLSAFYSYPGGWLSDRLGYKRALILFTLMAAAGYAFVIAVPTWWAAFVGALLFISWTAISLPAVMSLIAKSVPRERRTLGVTLHSLVRRVPMALGPLLGGLLITLYGVRTGVRLAFAAALVLAVVAIGVMHRYVRDDPAALKKPAPFRQALGNLQPALRNLLISDILVRFAEQIPYAFVVVWVVKNLGLSEAQFGLLSAIEMATAMLIYLPVAWLADRGTKKPYVVATFAFFTAFPLALYFSRSFWLLVLAFILRGLKEFGEPTRKALILDLAPEEAKAATFGTYYLIRDTVVGVVAFGGAWLWSGLSPAAAFFAASGCGLAGTLWFAWRGHNAAAPAGN